MLRVTATVLVFLSVYACSKALDPSAVPIPTVPAPTPTTIAMLTAAVAPETTVVKADCSAVPERAIALRHAGQTEEVVVDAISLYTDLSFSESKRLYAKCVSGIPEGPYVSPTPTPEPTPDRAATAVAGATVAAGFGFNCADVPDRAIELHRLGNSGGEIIDAIYKGAEVSRSNAAQVFDHCVAHIERDLLGMSDPVEEELFLEFVLTVSSLYLEAVDFKGEPEFLQEWAPGSKYQLWWSRVWTLREENRRLNGRMVVDLGFSLDDLHSTVGYYAREGVDEVIDLEIHIQNGIGRWLEEYAERVGVELPK